MKEAKGNLWSFVAELVVITTNGFVKNNGDAVMGRGCALEAKNKFPSLPHELGSLLRTKGNHVHVFHPYNLVTFPVKHNWFEEADVELIKRSCVELVELLDSAEIDSIVMPRPGCGNGKLSWLDVKPVISDLLDDRVTVITF